MVETAIHFGVWGGEVGGANLDRVLEDASRLGYSRVSIPLRNCDGMDVDAMRRAFEAARLQPLNTAGLSRNMDISSSENEVRRRGIEHLRHRVRIARDMGSRQINGVLYGVIAKAEKQATQAEFVASAESLAEVAEYALGCGVTLAIEIVNRYEGNLINTVDQALDYLKIADHPNIRIHLDTFHMSIEESDPLDAMKKAIPHLSYFELCQSHRGDLLEGTLHLERQLKQVLALGYRGLIGIEAFARERLAPDHANLLAIWRNPFADGTALASRAMSLIADATR
jgi:D-psicose/D-tagatose/L-ribulose 3-epimerase